MDKDKQLIYRQLMWDYDISPEDIDKLIKGEIQYAGHYDINSLFIKILNNFPWYTVIEILPIELVKKLLTDENINKLRFKSIRNQYAKLQKILRNETLSSARWYTKGNEQTAYPVLSNRWYGD